MIGVKVTATQGVSWNTSINCSFAEAVEYFLGNWFNVGIVDDKMVRVTGVELLNDRA